MPEQNHRSKVTVEDLLRLKRAERPSPEFWVGFERELRQKQLTALLDRRPWWHNLPQFLSRRAYLPIGATAALAFTLVTVRYASSTQVAHLDDSAAQAKLAALPVPIAAAGLTQNPSAEAMPMQRDEAVRLDDRTAVAANTTLSERLPEHTGGLTPWSAPHQTENSPARSIVATLATFEQAQPDLPNNALVGRVAVSSQLETAAVRTEELAHVAAVTSKRSRLLAQFEDRRFTPEPQAPEVLRERLTRRLAYEDMNDRYSRFDVKADKVLVKF